MMIIPFMRSRDIFRGRIFFTNKFDCKNCNNFNNDKYKLYDDVDVDAHMGARKGYMYGRAMHPLVHQA